MSRIKEQGLYSPANEHDACGIGAVVNIDGKKEHRIIEMAKQLLCNLSHRGAAGADEITGDGAGILMQIPHDFYKGVSKELGFTLPNEGEYGTGIYFGPTDEKIFFECEKMFVDAAKHYGFKILAERDVPRDNSCIGGIALEAEPPVKQWFLDNSDKNAKDEELERLYYLVRKRCEKAVNSKYSNGEADDFYICSLSARTVLYKGMFMADQLFDYYGDLSDHKATTALAIVHQRYSTNTFPSWKLAQPFRCIAHNGEINTLRGNRNHFKSGEIRMTSELFGSDIKDIKPVLQDDMSDSANFDNILELLVQGGRTMPHAMMMMMPEAFGTRYHISTDKRAFYEYHASIMEPWDGPAAMIFTDGKLLGGTLDRNGLRPSRFTVTNDGVVVLASETGVIDFDPAEVRQKGRLQPGKMFLVDTVEGRIISDREIKSKISRSKPYRRWLEDNRIELYGLYNTTKPEMRDREDLYTDMRVFGVTREELSMVLAPMAANGQEAIGSMGNDVPLAVLSNQPKSLFNYFKQLFAQVTNPPIDPLREGLVMSLMSFTGTGCNILEETPEHCKQLKLSHPVLTNGDMRRLRNAKREDLSVVTIPALFKSDGKDSGGKNLEAGLEKLVAAAKKASDDGAALIVISDKDHDEKNLPIPAMLAGSAVHHTLLDAGKRAGVGLILESGEPREVMHFCLLVGYGINAVNPYLTFEVLGELKKLGDIPEAVESTKLIDNYIAAVKKGMLKTISKMGISTIRSYLYAGLFEAIGLNKSFVEKYFTGTASRIGGIGLKELETEAIKRSELAYVDQTGTNPMAPFHLDGGSEYSYRNKGEKHMWTPKAVTRLQHAVQTDDTVAGKKAYDEFSADINECEKSYGMLRSMFDFVPGKSISIDEVEPASEIVKRFCTGAMSHGSISKETHECMAIAMNRIGGKNNTGEGGEDSARYTLEPNGDDKNSKIKQVASGRFGVTINYLAHAKELQIKMAQGAKPGEGGHLPGHKVTAEIARLRHSTEGVSLISPPPHHDIYSIEDLSQLIFDLKCSNPGVKVSVKLVSEVGVGTIAAGVAKGNADEVLISGGEGGSGATPLTSIKHAGSPWELGLAETQQTLILNGLRDRIRVQTDGQLRTGRDIVIAALLGAEQFGFGTAALVSLGCVLMRKCHLGTCPAGIATQKPELRSCFSGKPEYLQRYMFFVAEDARELMAQLGFKTIDDMIGRVERLATKDAIDFWKAKGLDFSSLFLKPDVGPEVGIKLRKKQVDKLEGHIDWKILDEITAVLGNGSKLKSGVSCSIDRKIRNIDRTIGTIISSHLVKQFGENGIPDDTVTLNLVGSAGQSLGAFLTKGVTINLIGDCNDYVGKGLSGGKIIIKQPETATYKASKNIMAGNTLLYGATSGEVYINGVAGERFGVRNSGVNVVVEGVGDHGCEYMTGGCVVILGKTGRNFAAGMSGGTAYVFDEHQLFDTLCNLDMVDLETVWQEEDIDILKGMIQKHYDYTGSKRAKEILDGWRFVVGHFVKVMPIDYKKALERMKEHDARSSETSPATEEVINNG